jgi:hypothetical protein
MNKYLEITDIDGKGTLLLPTTNLGELVYDTVGAYYTFIKIKLRDSVTDLDTLSISFGTGTTDEDAYKAAVNVLLADLYDVAHQQSYTDPFLSRPANYYSPLTISNIELTVS